MTEQTQVNELSDELESLIDVAGDEDLKRELGISDETVIDDQFGEVSVNVLPEGAIEALAN